MVIDTNVTGVFSNLTSGEYNIRIVDSQNNQRVIAYEVISFPVSTAVITNIQDINVSQGNGTVTVQTNNTQIRNTFRLRDAANNTVLLEHLGGMGEVVYTFQIPESLLNIIENTPTVFRRERIFYVEVFNQVCGSTNSSQFTIRDRRPLFVVDEIRCEQLNDATRTNSIRVFSETNININSSGYNQPRRDSNGNIVFTFFDINETACPISQGVARLVIDATTTQIRFTVTYRNVNNILTTAQLNNISGRTLDLNVFPNSEVIVDGESPFVYIFDGFSVVNGNANNRYITPLIPPNTAGNPNSLILSNFGSEVTPF